MRLPTLFFVFALAVFTGCSTTYQYKSSRINIVKRSGLNTDYFLLSLQGDSALLAVDCRKWKGHHVADTLVELIVKDSIAKILRVYKGDIEPDAWGLFNGGGTSIVGLIVVGAVIVPMVLWYVIYNAIPPFKEFFLNSEQDRIYLHSIQLLPVRD